LYSQAAQGDASSSTPQFSGLLHAIKSLPEHLPASTMSVRSHLARAIWFIPPPTTNHRSNTSAIGTLAVRTRACSTMGVFAGSARRFLSCSFHTLPGALRSNTPFKVRPLSSWNEPCSKSVLRMDRPSHPGLLHSTLRSQVNRSRHCAVSQLNSVAAVNTTRNFKLAWQRTPINARCNQTTYT